MRWVSAALALPLLGILVPLGAALSPLQGTLESPEPLRMTGPILVAPGGHLATAEVVLAGGDAPNGLVVMEAPRVRLVLLRWVAHENVAVLGTLHGRAGPAWEETVTDATLELRRFSDHPQALVDARAEPQSPMRIETDGSACEISYRGQEQTIAFPQDPNSLSRPVPHRTNSRLAAECGVSRIDAWAPHWTDLYGLDLWLASNERNELIRTGTFQEPVGPGGHVTQTVTQILRIVRVDDGLHLVFPLEAKLRLHSRAFMGVGELRTGPLEGDLTWGPWAASGPLQPLEATGSFTFRDHSPTRFAMEGTTLEGPPVRQQGTGAVGLSTWPAATVAAGLVAVGLVALAAWWLFSRLAPHRVLQHPQRERLLEAVRARPGVGTGEVARTLGLRWSHAAFHVLALQRAGHLIVHRLGGRIALFPARAGYFRKEASTALLTRATERRLYEAVLQAPGQTQAGLALALQLSQPRLCKVLKSMTSVGLILAEKRGRRFVYFATPPQGWPPRSERAFLRE